MRVLLSVSGLASMTCPGAGPSQRFRQRGLMPSTSLSRPAAQPSGSFEGAVAGAGGTEASAAAAAQRVNKAVVRVRFMRRSSKGVHPINELRGGAFHHTWMSDVIEHVEHPRCPGEAV